MLYMRVYVNFNQMFHEGSYEHDIVSLCSVKDVEFFLA